MLYEFKVKQKGLAPILIVLFIALGIGGYLIYQKQPKPVSISQPSSNPVTSDETANWKVYTSSQYGFSIKYPATMTLSPNKNGAIVYFEMKGQPGCQGCKPVMVFVRIERKTVAPEAIIADVVQKEYIKSGFSVTKDFQQIKIGNENGLLSINPGGLPALEYSQGAFVIHNNTEFSLILDTNGATNQQNLGAYALFKQILSTFKFL